MRGSALVACLLAACDPLAGSDYVGQPMFTIVGTFASSANAPADPVGGIALMWQDSVGAGGPGAVATAVPVEIEFPATFRVSVPLPPPPAARFKFDGEDVELAEAYVFVVQDPTAAQLVPLGLDRSHVLIYASADVAEGTLSADYLGGSVSAGYQLRSFTPATLPAAGQQAMIDRCVAGGAAAVACQARRDYQLGEISNDDPLRIVVAPP